MAGLDERHVVAHFARLPLVGKGHGRLFHIAFWRGKIVALVLVERAAQALRLAKVLRRRVDVDSRLAVPPHLQTVGQLD